MGRVSGITTKQNSGATPVTVLSSGTYKPFGGFAGANFGDGTSVTIGYDQDYELTSIAATKAVQNLSLSYDPASNISGITDSLNTGRSQTFGYDDLNRLNSASGVYGAQSYTYDGVGNRTGLTVGGTTSTYAIAATANQISTVTTGSNVRTFTYAASGQATGDQRTSTTDYTYTINNDGRLSAASLNGSTVGSYLYNGFGQRVQKAAGGATTDLIFDRFGHLIAEANDATGAPIREYIWMDDLPVAMVDDTGASPVVYYIHTDQLGSPQKVTDASGNVVWDGVFDPFGNAVANTGANWGTGIWGAFTWEPANPQTMPLRFPGQYADTETALNQNWFRDYDPSTGRYIESDPIGLDGGANTYAYVDQNPLVQSDASGEVRQKDNLPSTGNCTEDERKACECRCSPQRSVGCYVTIVWRVKALKGPGLIRLAERKLNCNCEDPEERPSTNFNFKPSPYWLIPLLLPWPGNPAYGGL